MLKDLEVTRAIQTLLIPKTSRIMDGDFRLDAYYEPSAQSGGDWWWYDELPGDRKRVLIGDVTGHGAGSAMVTAMVATAYQAARVALRRDLELPELFPIMNQTLRSICSSDYWVAFMAVEFDLKRNLLRYAGGGIPPLLLHRNDASISSLPAPQGGTLGFKEFSTDLREHSFEGGDRVLLCTDGAYEFCTHQGAPFGRKKLLGAFGGSRDSNLEGMVSELKAARANPKHFEDDVTILIASRGDQIKHDPTA